MNKSENRILFFGLIYPNFILKIKFKPALIWPPIKEHKEKATQTIMEQKANFMRKF
jgi:hypothetical protein